MESTSLYRLFIVTIAVLWSLTAMCDNAGDTDFYDGGPGMDALRLVLSEAQLSDANVIAELAAYRTSADHANLPGFDQELDHSFKPVAQSGPFGLQVDAFRLVEAEGQELVEISIEALSGELPNMTVESLHEVSGDTRARLVITSANDAAGNDLFQDFRTAGVDA